VYGTVIANQYRADLKDQGKGTGNYGFTIPIPAGLKDGATHTLNVRVKGKSYIVPTAAPRTLMCPANEYAGNFDIVDCNSARGWVWDKNNSGAALTIELYEGATVYATGVANIYKETLKNEGKGTGNYGFSLPIPASLRDGKAHSLSIRVKGTTYSVTSSPRSLTCGSNAYEGSFFAVDCSSARGWVWDKNNADSTMTVELYEGSTVYGTVIANQYRADLKDQGKGTGNYGFTIPIPAGLKDGATHTLNVRVKGKSYIVPTAAPRTLMCPANVYAGNFDIVDCNSARGWVWDKNNSGAALTIELYEGATVYATGVANIYKETLKNEGKGTGNYGFSLPIPASLRDGKAHSLSIRVKGTTYSVTSSPRSLTCGSNAYEGSFFAVDCSSARGWVWDKNNADSTMTVELYEGSTVYGTVIAN
ncbi:T9SS C-terminal target domain-containing protein, partial [Dyadobacter sp. CY351]|nr:T9SS C-terminal target domain-containing protein [Dyadobacter sp. CY351]